MNHRARKNSETSLVGSVSGLSMYQPCGMVSGSFNDMLKKTMVNFIKLLDVWNVY